MSNSLSKPPTRELDPPENWLPTQNDHRNRATWRDKLWAEVDTKRTTTSMVWACFLTGLTSAVSFSACYIWCGFQTGGVAQLGIAVARLFGSHRTSGFLMPDKQALCSLLSFLLGTSLGRFGDKIGPHRRIWLISATVAQALSVMAAAIAAHYSGQSGIAGDREDPSWTNPTSFAALGFMSASLGLQGIIGVRLNTPFGTAVVLTTVWVTTINDPFLFALRLVPSRDHRLLSIAAVFVGAFVSRALIDSIGPAGTLGICAGLRFLGAAGWMGVRDKPKVGAV
ncbi:hypothetical protein HD553DRAFT_343756 [Filobasidium floriforme]|uniref:uncharacterized protein n=1 Tax=Filobasidium floriforme TaxID=5210 RepID=UPI001E8DC3C5|nr:uncharacterized protein HD553DRAFT_343756 [Filobasidium floriforme]KAH8082362.1 hypothetical protein HD553DRAFT_343756 [Filobasidium floriforme]